MTDLLQLILPLALLLSFFMIVMHGMRWLIGQRQAKRAKANASQLEALRGQSHLLEDVARSVDSENEK